MSQLLLAQTYQPGDSSLANGLVQTTDDDYVIAGRIFDFNRPGNSAAAAIRVAPSGTVIWQNIYSEAFTVFFKAITQVTDGNLAATGSFFFSEFAGDESIWAVKLNEAGEKIWEETFGNAQDEQSDGQDIAATTDGGFVIVGSFLVKGGNRSGTRVLKFDASNRLEWDQRFETGIAFAIRQTHDGGYILSGTHNIPNSLNSNPFVLRLDAKGDKLWEQVYTGFEVYVLLDSGIVATKTGNFTAVFKSVVMEINDCGEIIWAHQSSALNLGTVTELPGSHPVAGGSLIVNNFDHAYVTALGERGLEILWDNTEIAFPSGVTRIIPNKAGLVAATGYLPININQSQMFLAVYNPTRTIVP